MLALASCNKNEDLGVSQNGNYPQDGQVRISTTVNEQKTRSGDSPYTGADLSLSVNYGASDAYTKSNIQWTTADGGTTWTPATQMLWKNATATAAIYAYAPHQASVTDLTTVPFSVATDQSAGLASSDLLGYVNGSFVPGSSLTTANALEIAFAHKLSKLTLNITFGNQFATTPTIANVTLHKTLPTISYNAQTGAVGAASGTSTSIMMHPVSGVSYDAILAPQTVGAATQMITVMLAGSPVQYYNYTVPAGGHEFVSGSAYVMNLKVGKDKIEQSDITVGEWGAGEDIPGGEAGEGA